VCIEPQLLAVLACEDDTLTPGLGEVKVWLVAKFAISSFSKVVLLQTVVFTRLFLSQAMKALIATSSKL
jgi:hypothetical protein